MFNPEILTAQENQYLESLQFFEENDISQILLNFIKNFPSWRQNFKKNL